jgi:hypothetical protein
MYTPGRSAIPVMTHRSTSVRAGSPCACLTCLWTAILMMSHGLCHKTSVSGISTQGEDDVGACTLPYALIVRSATTRFSPLPILTSNEILPGLTIVQCTTATPAAFVFTALVVPHAMLYAGFAWYLTFTSCTSARAVSELLTFAINLTTDPTRTLPVAFEAICSVRTGAGFGSRTASLEGSAGLRVPVQRFCCRYLCAAAACTRP